MNWLKIFSSVLVIIVFPSQSVFAEVEKKCSFTLNCLNGEKNFSLEFKSISGDCIEDDMQISYVSSHHRVELNLQKNWYFYTDHISRTQSSICKGLKEINDFSAYSITSHKAIFFIKASGRPGHNFVLAVLLDTDTGTILDQKRLGRSRNNYVAVLKHKRGFKVRIIRDSLSFHKQVSCDCDAPFVDDWMEINIKGNKILSGWIN